MPKISQDVDFRGQEDDFRGQEGGFGGQEADFGGQKAQTYPGMLTFWTGRWNGGALSEARIRQNPAWSLEQFHTPGHP